MIFYSILFYFFLKRLLSFILFPPDAAVPTLLSPNAAVCHPFPSGCCCLSPILLPPTILLLVVRLPPAAADASLSFFLQVHKDVAVCQPSFSFFYLMCLALPPSQDVLVCQKSFFLKLLLSVNHPFSSLCCCQPPSSSDSGDCMPGSIVLHILLSNSHPSFSRF